MKKMGEIEKKYGVDFDVRSDMKLATYLKKIGFPKFARLLTNLDKNE